MFVLAPELAPGDSGAPLVDQSGAVVGVAFAIDPAADTTAYPLTNDSSSARSPDTLPTRTAETGSCLVG